VVDGLSTAPNQNFISPSTKVGRTQWKSALAAKLGWKLHPAQ